MFPDNVSVNRFVWDKEKGRYFNVNTGKYVSPSVVRKSIDRLITASDRNIGNITKQLQQGKISLSDWQLQMMSQIKILHTANGISAAGGWQSLSKSDFAFISKKVKEQYKFLNRFSKEIKNGSQSLNGAANRAHLYSQAGRNTYEEMNRRLQEKYGNNEERRVLGIADHCKGCLAEARKGWKPIGTLLPIGAAQCKVNCHCEFEYRYNRRRK